MACAILRAHPAQSGAGGRGERECTALNAASKSAGNRKAGSARQISARSTATHIGLESHSLVMPHASNV